MRRYIARERASWTHRATTTTTRVERVATSTRVARARNENDDRPDIHSIEKQRLSIHIHTVIYRCFQTTLCETPRPAPQGRPRAHHRGARIRLYATREHVTMPFNVRRARPRSKENTRVAPCRRAREEDDDATTTTTRRR